MQWCKVGGTCLREEEHGVWSCMLKADGFGVNGARVPDNKSLHHKLKQDVYDSSLACACSLRKPWWYWQTCTEQHAAACSDFENSAAIHHLCTPATAYLLSSSVASAMHVHSHAASVFRQLHHAGQGEKFDVIQQARPPTLTLALVRRQSVHPCVISAAIR